MDVKRDIARQREAYQTATAETPLFRLSGERNSSRPVAQVLRHQPADEEPIMRKLVDAGQCRARNG